MKIQHGVGGKDYLCSLFLNAVAIPFVDALAQITVDQIEMIATLKELNLRVAAEPLQSIGQEPRRFVEEKRVLCPHENMNLAR